MGVVKTPEWERMRSVVKVDYRMRLPMVPESMKLVVWGGPFLEKPDSLDMAITVNMAAEINRKADFWIKTRDFSVPPEEPVLDAMGLAVMQAIVERRAIYVGCMGGIGRTGLFMASLAKLCGYENPVGWVRQNFKPHAVETAQQKSWVEQLPVTELRWHLARVWWAGMPYRLLTRGTWRMS